MLAETLADPSLETNAASGNRAFVISLDCIEDDTAENDGPGLLEFCDHSAAAVVDATRSKDHVKHRSKRPLSLSFRARARRVVAGTDKSASCHRRFLGARSSA